MTNITLQSLCSLRIFFSSVISFCCKQHLCTLDKFNNHESVYNPYWAVSCFILPIKISAQWWVERGLIPATETPTERGDAPEPWKSRRVTQGRARRALRLSTRALSLSLIPPLVSEKPLAVTTRPLLTLFHQLAGWLFLPGAFAARCPQRHASLASATGVIFPRGTGPALGTKCQQWVVPGGGKEHYGFY